MRKVLHLSAFLFLFVLVFGGCKRYEENEDLTLKSAKKRIVGTWKMVKVGSENYPLIESQSDSFADNCGNTWSFTTEYYRANTWIFTKDRYFTNEVTEYETYLNYNSYDNCTVNMEKADNSSSYTVSWEFTYFKNYVSIYYNNSILEITKLTDDELHFKFMDGFKIELEKVK